MAMRLYHRRSSASRDRLDKLQVPNGLCLSNSLRLQNLSVGGHRDSLGLNRPRSQSLFPGSDQCLAIPPRSRSASFSGASRGPEYTLTASEEEHIFQCYTRVMYILLGGLAVTAMGLVLYGVHAFANFKWKKNAQEKINVWYLIAVQFEEQAYSEGFKGRESFKRI